MWFKLSRLILRNRLLILILLGLGTAFMGYRSQFVTMSYQMAQMLPQSDTTYIEYEQFKNKFGKDGSIVVAGISDKNLFKLANFNAWYDLTYHIKNIKVDFVKNGKDTIVNGITEALSIANYYSLKKDTAENRFDFEQIVKKKPETQAELDSLKDVLKNLPFYNGYLFIDSSSTTLIAITIDTNVLNSKYRDELFEQIDAEVLDFEVKTGIKVHKSGLPYIRANSTTKMKDEIQLFILLSVLITALILYLFFRSFKAMLYSMLVVCVGVVWSLGIQSLFGYHITILTGLIPPLIIVIGIPNCIFLLNKYHTEYKNHGNQIKALSRVIQKIGTAIFLTNTTTAIGFATFIFTKSSILVEFGVLASISIILVFFLSLLIIPIVFSFLTPPKKRHIKHLENKKMAKIIMGIEHLVKYHRKAIYMVTILIVSISIYGISLITTTGNIIDDLPKHDPIVEDLMFFESHFNGVMPFEVVIDTKTKNGVFADNAKVLYKIQKLQRELSAYKEFSKPLSITEAIKFSYQAYKKGNPKFYILPPATELKKLKKYVQNDSRKNKFSAFIDDENQVTRVSFQIADIGTKEMDVLLSEIRPKIDSIFSPAEYKVTLTGTSVVFLKGTHYLVHNLITSLLLAIILIASLMSVLFSSFRMVIVSLSPNLIPLITTAGLMGFFSVPIKPSTILIFSIAFGIAVDDTIHFLAKYKQELKHHKWNIKESVYIALRETSPSMIYTSIILFFGFGVFTVSSFGGTIALGFLVSVTLLFAILADLLVLPSLLLSLDKALTTRAFKREALIEFFDDEEDINLDKLEVKPIQHQEIK
ncbi:MAG: transporter [Flavobacteriales bacterium CG_4_10_14_0_2_um_filter_32_8]|nr:MAG: transporter [Flavobacteriales bacterium CG_4_10_14_0_2_um_filter_32_8]PJB15844.1 MAG: transporter [Flavobacteriales bacterium CG_4_9_14_3_um_filter_32_8]